MDSIDKDAHVSLGPIRLCVCVFLSVREALGILVFVFYFEKSFCVCVVSEAPLNIYAKFVCPQKEIERGAFPTLCVSVCVLSSLKLIEAEGSACPLMRGTDLRNKESQSMIEGEMGDEKK